MAKRYFNWKLAVVVAMGLAVLGITGYKLRQWQRDRGAEQGLILGNKAYNERRWEDAARNLGRYLAVVKDDVPAMLKYADAQLKVRPIKRNNVHQAIAAYRTILRMARANSEAATRVTEIYLGMGMPGEAELIATRALKTNKSPELRRVLAIALADQRKLKEAVKELKSIIEEHPEQILAYGVLGRLVEQHPEDFSQKPEFWFDEAVKNNPSSAHAYVIRGAFHLRHNRRPQAVADLAQAEQKDLSDPTTRLQLAEQFLNVGDMDKAQEHLEIVRLSEPDNQLLWRIWARLAMKFDSGVVMLQVAENGLKELSPDPWDFMPLAAELYIRCGELDRAADLVNKLHQNDIAPAATAFLEGLLADSKGHGYEALKCWRKATQLGLKSAQIRIAMAATLSRLGDKYSAIRQLRTLVSEQPNLLSGRLNFARLLTRTGDWDEAAEQARIAMQISPDSTDAALMYWQACIQLLSESQRARDSLIYRDIEEHLANLEQAPNSTPEVKFLQSQLAIQQGDFVAAEALIGELREAYPSQLKIVMAEIELLTACRKIDEAILKSYDAVSAFPNSVGPVRHLANLLAAKGDHQKSESIIKEALSRIKQPAAEQELGLLLASLYDQWNEQEKRYQVLDALVRKHSEDIPLRRAFLECESVLNNTSLAQELVDQIKTIEGENSWQWRYEQAKIFAAQDDFKDHYPQITMLLKEVLLTNPDDQASRMLLARTYERAGELRLAVSTYNEALSRSPRDIRIIIRTVAALYKADEYDRADKILRQSADEKLFHPDLKKLQLYNQLRRGQLGSACDILENWLANDPNNAPVCFCLALLKIRQKSFTEAAELLGQLEPRQPNSLPIRAAQIELNIRQDNPTEALLLCDKIVSELGNASAYVLRGRAYAMLGRAERAKKDFEHATVIEPNNAKAWAAMSDFWRSAGHPSDAIGSIRKAMSLEPNDLAIRKRAVSLFLAWGNRNAIREAKSILDYAITSYPEDAELRLYEARLLLAEGTAPATERAGDILQKVTEDQPNLSGAWALWAEIALRQDQLAKGMDIVLRGLFHQPNDKSLLLLKARLETASSPALAVPTLKALLDSDPNDIAIALLLADTYLAAGQSEEAVNLLKKLLVSCGSDAEQRKIRIALDRADAEKEFDSLFRSDPNDPDPLLAQVRLLKEEGLWQQLNQKVIDWYRNHPTNTHTPVAIASYLAESKNSKAEKTAEGILRMMLEHDSDCTEAMIALAMLLQTTERPREAAELYQRVLTLQPDDIITINNLAWILCEEHGKYQQALEFARRGLEKAPDYIDLIDTRGVAYYRLGEFKKAVQDLNQCVNLYPPRAPSLVASHFHLARALARLGQKDEAIENLNKSLELNNKIGGLSATDFEEAHRLLGELLLGG